MLRQGSPCDLLVGHTMQSQGVVKLGSVVPPLVVCDILAQCLTISQDRVRTVTVEGRSLANPTFLYDKQDTSP